MDAIEANITATCPLPFAGVTGGLFLKAMTAVIASHCAILDDYHWPPDEAQDIINRTTGVEFDFVVVGAGTAGSLLASQLSNIFPTLSTLLIEAGDNPSIDTEIPAFLFLNQNSTNDWSYKTKPDGNSCLGFNNNSCIWSKGKGLGGSSSINAMIYIRGHPKNFQEWEDMGNPGWGYKELSKYFDEQERHFTINDPNFEGYDNPWYDIIDSAWKELGYTSYKYKGHEALIGTKISRLLTENGKRMNTAKKYFKGSGKITIMKNTLVERLIFDLDKKQVTGVTVRHEKGTRNISAKKEVILSAGSIATPQILMLSGIGPKTHLLKMGIPCIQNLPVGQNLQDHMLLPIFLKTNQNVEISPNIITMLLLQYMLTRTGPFANIGVTDYMGFVDTNEDSDYPDIQFHYTYITKNDNFVLRPYLEGLGYKSEIIRAIEALNHEHDLLGIYPTLLHPKSKGEILLAAPDLSDPIIKTNYLQHPADMRSFLRAVNFIHKLTETETFKATGIRLTHIKIPNCLKHTFDTENYWECYIRHMATTIYHPVGTTKMGPREDDTSVIGSDLNVYGVKNLRIVDASIMPTIPGANTMAAVLALAQKAADIIKNEYRTKDEL